MKHNDGQSTQPSETESEIENLKAEIIELKKDRDYYKDMCFGTVAELQRQMADLEEKVNEKLNVKNVKKNKK